jgi:hypothetical protein
MNTKDDNILFVGIDLGDKTLTIDSVKNIGDGTTAQMTLPGTTGINNDKDILFTMFGYLKKESTQNNRVILSDSIGDYEPEDFVQIYTNFKKRPSQIDKSNSDYKIATKLFLNRVLHSSVFKDSITAHKQNKEKIYYCFGYPTNWNNQDIEEFKEIINSVVTSDMGKVTFERESVAALIALQSDKALADFNIKNDECILILDFGSATLNITALKLNSDKPLYNSGENYFGCRLIDYAILEEIYKSFLIEDRELFENLSYNDTIWSSLVLLDACNLKEKFSKSSLKKARQEISLYKAKKYNSQNTQFVLDKNIFEDIVMNTDISYLMERYDIAPKNVCKKYKGFGYKSYLRKYLESEIIEMKKQKIFPDKVIVTGGGSLLYTIQDVCKEIFGLTAFFDADNSKRIISKGLALAAANQKKSLNFEKDVKKFIDTELSKLIEKEIPQLINSIKDDVTNIILNKLIKPELTKWRDGKIKTIENVENNVINNCKYNLGKLINEDKDIISSVDKWSKNVLGDSIARELKLICTKYSVDDFEKISNLNIFDNQSNLVNGADNIAENVIEPIISVIVVIANIIVMPIFISVIVALFIIFIPILAGIPVAGWVMLGIGALSLLAEGPDAIENWVRTDGKKVNIPNFTRKLLSNERIEKMLREQKSTVSKKIEEALLDKKQTEKIAFGIKASISPQIQKLMQHIMYGI